MRPGAGVLLLGLLPLVGCAARPVLEPVAKAARDDLIVLLPEPEGKAAALSVAHAGVERVLDRPYAAARIRQEGSVETGVSSPEEVRRMFGDALAAQPPRPISFLLYFVEGKDELTPASRQVLRDVLAEIARRPAPEVVVIGHTDRVGSVTFNDGLSRRRAEKVRDDLVGQGVPTERIGVAGRGEREPLVPTEDEVPEARNRRVEVSVR